MSDYNINNMDFKQLRNEVQLLRDELAIMKRKYEDIIYNLDTDNFSSRFVKEQGDMRTAIEINAEGIKTKVSNEEFQSSITQTNNTIETEVKKLDDSVSSKITQTANEIGATVENVENTLSSRITQTENLITSEVKNLSDADSKLSSRITQSANKISAVIEGDYTEDILSNYLTGIEIEPNVIKMLATKNSYSTFSGNGLRFYDSSGQVEGWSIEPDAAKGYGGVLNYYVNGQEGSDKFEPCFTFGTGISGDGYTSTDMVLKAINGQRGKFVVDLTESAYKEVRFLVADWSSSGDSPRVLANGQLLATQVWVMKNFGGGSSVAKFA